MIQASAFVRVEGSVSYWRAVTAGGERGPLMFTELPSRPPEEGDMVVIPDIGAVRISAVHPLKFTTGDLREREKFDPRRIFELASGSRVAFKRVENGRVVMWSYTKKCEVAMNTSIELVPTDDHAAAIAGKGSKLTQKILAAWLIKNNPEITGSELELEIMGQFPNCRVGKRHGNHYLSLSRRGKLPEPPDEDPRPKKAV